GTSVQAFEAIDLLPLVGRTPCRIALLGQRVRRRAEAQRVQEQGLVVAFPAVLQKAALRLPPVGDRRSAVQSPPPVGPAVEGVGKGTDLLLLAGVVVEIRSRCECPCEQKGAIDGR